MAGATFSLYGADTIKIAGNLIETVGSGEVAKLSYASELATVKTGKNGNTIFAQNASGFQASLEVKVIRGGKDDKDLNGYLNDYRTNPTGFVVKDAEIVKTIGDGAGKAVLDTYILNGGVPTKQVEAVVNTEGDTEQGISVYTFVFATCSRQLSI
jgi:hypothetical protein